MIKKETLLNVVLRKTEKTPAIRFSIVYVYGNEFFKTSSFLKEQSKCVLYFATLLPLNIKVNFSGLSLRGKIFTSQYTA